MKNKLSIIIVSYNNVELLKQCIESIFLHNDIGDAIEIIISDNSPNLDLYNDIKASYENIKIIHNISNGGFGYGNNRGFEISTGEYLLFLNQDTYLIEPVFQWAIDLFERDEMLAAFGVRLVKPSLDRNFSYGLLDGAGILDWVKTLVCWHYDYFIEGKMFTSGANLFLRREVFEEIGLFDEKIFMYYEESDILHRISMLNSKYKMKYFNDKRIVHLEGATQKKDNNSLVNTYKKQLSSFKYYCTKHNLSYERYIKKDIRLFRLRMMKYYLKHDLEKLELEKQIIQSAKVELREDRK